VKKTILLLIIILCHLQTGMAQITSDTAVAVVQKQLDAYNAKDLSLFLSVFHTDAALYNLGNETPIARGE
jgi:succinate dehydrogenase hydrophobic anchor subunit